MHRKLRRQRARVWVPFGVPAGHDVSRDYSTAARPEAPLATVDAARSPREHMRGFIKIPLQSRRSIIPSPQRFPLRYLFVVIVPLLPPTTPPPTPPTNLFSSLQSCDFKDVTSIIRYVASETGFANATRCSQNPSTLLHAPTVHSLAPLSTSPRSARTAHSF